jgi:hypothetical protein
LKSEVKPSGGSGLADKLHRPANKTAESVMEARTICVILGILFFLSILVSDLTDAFACSLVTELCGFNLNK